VFNGTTERVSGAASGSGFAARGLFHAATPEALEAIVSGGTAGGLDSRMARDGEYGSGAYFAEHAIYSVALRDWLNTHGAQAPAIGSTTKLLLCDVVLGDCKDFGASCASNRSGKGKICSATCKCKCKRKHLKRDTERIDSRCEWQCSEHCQWPLIHEKRARGPIKVAGEVYDSVCGTEQDLDWCSPRLKAQGSVFGKQYVAFDTGQSYPQFLLELVCKGTANGDDDSDY
jgi:hypothetical protein